MPEIPNGKYTKEFNEEAVKLITVHGHSIDGAAIIISVPKPTLVNWIRAYNAGKLSQICKSYKEKIDRTFLQHIRVSSKDELKERILKGISELIHFRLYSDGKI